MARSLPKVPLWDGHEQRIEWVIRVPTVPDWLALVLGIVILWLVFSERRDIAWSWRHPARWWSRDPEEYMRSRSPSQPLNVLVGMALGVAAIVYGIVALIA